MKIVILDGQTANPGDLTWDGIAEMGELTVYDRTRPDQVIARCADAEIVFTNKTHVGRAELTASPKMRYLGLLSTGTNSVDLAAASDLGIPVTHIPAYSTPTVAQNVFALLLEMTNQVSLHNQAVHESTWVRSLDFCFTLSPIIELSGLTLGIIGFGSIGRAVADIGRAFGMRVIVHTRRVPAQGSPGVTFVELETLLVESDVVSLHCPLNENTSELIRKETLQQMKPSAMLINTGRGGLINEDDLAEALNSGCLAAAGLDVLSTEPPGSDHVLLTAKNCVMTPHISWASQAARRRLIEIATANLRTFLDGKPINVVEI